MLSAIPDAMLRIAADGRVVAYHRGTSVLDLDVEDCVGKQVNAVLPEPIASILCAEADGSDDTAGIRTAEFTTTSDDRTIHLEARRVRAGGEQALVFVRDITRRKETEAKIRSLAYQDGLTGLPNRQAFLETLERALANARGLALAVIFLDLDGFKRVNDTLGHGVGDHLLQAVADRLKQCTRSSDTLARPRGDSEIARLGGDEFTILLRDIERPENAVAVAQRIRDTLKRPFTIAMNEISVTASMGISFYPDDASDAASLLKYADTAMYHAKDSGRNTFKLYSASLTARVMERVELENGLRKALARNELVLHYQPQVASPDNRITGMEALLRWNHPERGLLSPAEFVGMAEETGLIVPIGEWVLRTACAEARRWQDAAGRPVRIAVNLSAVQFRADNLVPTVRAILTDTGIAPELLELEITESTLMDSTDATIRRLNELKAAGIHVSIDDFGTGYSSMSYLKRFPVNALKIDRSFLLGLPQDAENVAILRAIIAMAHGLKIGVIAEGVETADQAALVRAFGCDDLQGFHFGRPVPPDQAIAMLARNAAAAAEPLRLEASLAFADSDGRG
jgi:diguanylate cyclase (GGDEF)-like protein